MAVTEAESVLLQVLWRFGPLPSKPLIEAVRVRQSWGDATIKTLLNRLMRKGAIRSDRGGGVLVYVPALSREDYVAAEVDALVQRAFEGDHESLRLWTERWAAESSSPARDLG